MKKDALIIVRGGGDLATGTIHRLCSECWYWKRHSPQPSAVR